MITEIWVSYVDANDVQRHYKTPCRRHSHAKARVLHLLRKKPKNRAGYAKEITLRIVRPLLPVPAKQEAVG